MRAGAYRMALVANVTKTFGIAVVHQMLCTVGVLLLSGATVFTICSLIRLLEPSLSLRVASHILTEIPGCPVQLFIGIFLGFSIGKILPHRIMLWVWVLPLLVVAIGLLWNSSDESATSPALLHAVQIAQVALLIASLGYSVGAMASGIRFRSA